MNDQLGGFFSGLNGPLGGAIPVSFGTRNDSGALPIVRGALIDDAGNRLVTDSGDVLVYAE